MRCWRSARGRCPFHEAATPTGAGLFGRRAERSPVMYKQDLAESFDLLTTDRRLTTSAIARHLQGVSGPDPLLLDEYRVLASGGTSGIATYVPFDRVSWQRVLGAYVWIVSAYGFGPRLLPRRRIAQITAGGAVHMTNRMATSSRSPAYPVLRLDVTAPVSELAPAWRASVQISCLAIRALSLPSLRSSGPGVFISPRSGSPAPPSSSFQVPAPRSATHGASSLRCLRHDRDWWGSRV